LAACGILEAVGADIALVRRPQHPGRFGLDFIAPRDDLADHVDQAAPGVFMTLQFGRTGVGLVVQIPQVDDIAIELDGVPVSADELLGLRDFAAQLGEICDRFADLGTYCADGGRRLGDVIVPRIERLSRGVGGPALPAIKPRSESAVSAAATASAVAATVSAVTAVAGPISGAEDPAAAPQHPAIPAVVSAHSSRRSGRPDLPAAFGAPQTTVIPDEFAFRGVLNGAPNEGGKIIGPEERAWGLRGVATAAERGLVSGSKVRDLSPVLFLRGLITLTKDPFAPHPRDHRGDHQNDHQRDAHYDKRGTHEQILRVWPRRGTDAAASAATATSSFLSMFFPPCRVMFGAAVDGCHLS
jgi:hypothetical protein